MNKKGTSKGLMLIGSLRKAGVTTYMKQGKMITFNGTVVGRFYFSKSQPRFFRKGWIVCCL